MAITSTSSNITAKNGFLDENPAITRMPTTQIEWNAFIQTLQRWVKDQEYSLTFSVTGFTTDPESLTATAHRYGKIVILNFNTFSATSNSNFFVLQTLPTELRPSETQIVAVSGLIDSGGNIVGGATIETGGRIVLNADGASSSWTTSGTKGINTGAVAVYTLFDAELTK